MGDAGEGLIDADARIQERMDELEQARKKRRPGMVGDPEQLRKIESLRLARTATERRLEGTTNDALKRQLQTALTDLDNQIKALQVEAKPAKSK
jgi:hypothetical protein